MESLEGHAGAGTVGEVVGVVEAAVTKAAVVEAAEAAGADFVVIVSVALVRHELWGAGVIDVVEIAGHTIAIGVLTLAWTTRKHWRCTITERESHEVVVAVSIRENL